MPVVYDQLDSPIGRLWVAVSDRGLCGVEFDVPEDEFRRELQRRYAAPMRTSHGIESASDQIQEYLAGARRAFALRLNLDAAPAFHRAALAVCAAIPYGETSTYAGLAGQLGQPRGARAVGNAMARNPIPLIIPCHRVLRSDGSLGGFRGGLPIKRQLLALERDCLASDGGRTEPRFELNRTSRR